VGGGPKLIGFLGGSTRAFSWLSRPPSRGVFAAIFYLRQPEISALRKFIFIWKLAARCSAFAMQQTRWSVFAVLTITRLIRPSVSCCPALSKQLATSDSTISSLRPASCLAYRWADGGSHLARGAFLLAAIAVERFIPTARQRVRKLLAHSCGGHRCVLRRAPRLAAPAAPVAHPDGLYRVLWDYFLPDFLLAAICFASPEDTKRGKEARRSL